MGAARASAKTINGVGACFGQVQERERVWFVHDVATPGWQRGALDVRRVAGRGGCDTSLERASRL